MLAPSLLWLRDVTGVVWAWTSKEVLYLYRTRYAFYLWCGIENLKIKGVNVLFYIKMIYDYKWSCVS